MLHRSIPLARFLQNYLPELWGFIFGGVFGPKFSVSLAAKNTLDAKMFWRSKNGMDLLHHHAEYGGAWISCTTQRQEMKKFDVIFFVFCLVCLSHFSTVEFSLMTLPSRCLNMETLLITLEMEGSWLCTCVQLRLCATRWCHHRMLELKILEFFCPSEAR